jgi:hypothetical protein
MFSTRIRSSWWYNILRSSKHAAEKHDTQKNIKDKIIDNKILLYRNDEHWPEILYWINDNIRSTVDITLSNNIYFNPEFCSNYYEHIQKIVFYNDADALICKIKFPPISLP